jgi:hypothetical protein
MRIDEDSLSKGAGPSDAGTLRVVLAQGQAFLTEEFPSASGTIVLKAADDAAAVTLHSVDASIQHTVLVNEASKPAFVKFGTQASATDYSFVLGAFETYVIPFRYTGSLTARWEAGFVGTPNMRITSIRE